MSSPKILQDPSRFDNLSYSERARMIEQ